MSMEKQIEEMVEIIKPFVGGLACEEESGACEFVNCQHCRAREIAMKIYNADYRKINDDHHKQVACYTLGCQEGDKIARQVAAEIFAEIETSLVIGGFVNGEKYIAIREDDYNHYKKKYTGEGK